MSTALLYFVFFYPFALAHLGANDMADVTNDRARGLKTIPVLYGMTGAARWVLAFALLHAAAAVLFAAVLGPIARVGLIARVRLRHGRERRAHPPPGGVGRPSPAPALSPGPGALRGGIVIDSFF